MGITPDSVRLLRQRLSPDLVRPISQQRFGDLVGVTWATVNRWERDGCRSERFVRKLARLERVLNVLGDQVRPEHRLAFFTQRHPLMLRCRPIDLLESGDGLSVVLGQIEGGWFQWASSRIAGFGSGLRLG